MPVRAGSLDELRKEGRLLTKVGALPVVVFWHDDRAWAIEDRCPHMGFPLHQGTVESGLVTCHWHHARFDLVTGLHPRPLGRRRPRLRGRRSTATTCSSKPRRRRRSGRAPLPATRRRPGGGPLARDRQVGARAARRRRRPRRDRAARRRLRHALPRQRVGRRPHRARRDGQRAPHARRRPTARSRSCTGSRSSPATPATTRRASRCARSTTAARSNAIRLAEWYRRFVETRSGDAAERVLATALAEPGAIGDVERMMFAAVTDHVFVDGGHTIDFTNKAFEALGYVGPTAAPDVLPTARAPDRVGRPWSEQSGTWRHPHDLAGADRADAAPARRRHLPPAPRRHGDVHRRRRARVAAPRRRSRARRRRAARRDRAPAPTPSSSAARSPTRRRCGSRASTCRTTSATGTPCTTRSPPPTRCTSALGRVPDAASCCAALVHGALRVYLDRFLNVPAARLPDARDRRPRRPRRVLGDPGRGRPRRRDRLRLPARRRRPRAARRDARPRAAARGRRVPLVPGVRGRRRQFHAWPAGSEEGVLILAGLARFLAAHTPTRRELSRGRRHRHPPPPRRGALRRGLTREWRNCRSPILDGRLRVCSPSGRTSTSST